MKGLYAKLALDGIRKNKQIYFPYILTCSIMSAMCYIITFLSSPQISGKLPGGDNVSGILNLGTVVIVIFSVLFLFYTNSFLMRRRKKEFGLYNVLGMDKNALGKIILFEFLFTALFSLTLGLIAGTLFSKLAELILLKLLGETPTGELGFSFASMKNTLLFYFGVLFVIMISALYQVRKNDPLELLNSEKSGEKTPKANPIAGAVGIVMLCAAYYMAVSVTDPLSALGLFFAAVLLVIGATYLIMISGSVMICKLLQKNKKFYYTPKHFISVSLMSYRMKRNGAGLASICIISTMVLVMLSTTTCLYFGVEDSLRSTCPSEINVKVSFKNADDMGKENIAVLDREIISAADKNNLKLKDEKNFPFVLWQNEESDDENKEAQIFYIAPLSAYNAANGTNETLKDDEVLLHEFFSEYKDDKIRLNQVEFNLKNKVKHTIAGLSNPVGAEKIYLAIVPDENVLLKLFSDESAIEGRASFYGMFGYDTDQNAPIDSESGLDSTLAESITNEEGAKYETLSVSVCSIDRADYYSSYGSLLFLAVVLSLMFLIAAVLMIYYKQISEGFEDAGRFSIMRRVGMTKDEIKRNINSQILMVFFLPLMMAALHLVFAFPMIRKMLLLFGLNNIKLFTETTLISFAVFALFYTLVYKLTSNEYYKIVSEIKK